MKYASVVLTHSFFRIPFFDKHDFSNGSSGLHPVIRFYLILKCIIVVYFTIKEKFSS